MKNRERFRATMHYEDRDRVPIADFGFWDETLEAWKRQGYPDGVHPDDFFGMDPWYVFPPVNVGLCPAFERAILEDRGDTVVVRDHEGVLCEESKAGPSIPHYIDWTLKDRASFEKEFRPRLDPAHPGRYPDDWDRRVAELRKRDFPLGLQVGSLYGWIRDWMGVENVSLLVYDDPDLFGEMVETVADCVLGTIGRALQDLTFEFALFWEDMCFRHGPLLSPSMFDRFLVPHYRRITSELARHGIDVVMVDCDGKIDELIPLWMKAGVNCMFPIEVGAWGADPVVFRREYGPELLLVGGFDKRILARHPDEIRREIDRLAPLVDEGGYIPTPDHRVPADVPLKNHCFYVEEAKRIWGRSVDVRPSRCSEIGI